MQTDLNLETDRCRFEVLINWDFTNHTNASIVCGIDLMVVTVRFSFMVAISDVGRLHWSCWHHCFRIYRYPTLSCVGVCACAESRDVPAERIAESQINAFAMLAERSCDACYGRVIVRAAVRAETSRHFLF